jgi:cold shock CspA family protein
LESILNEFYKLKGKIQKYFSFRGYGFIETDESEDNFFFHKSNYPPHEIPSIGQNVEFKIVETPKGNEAQDIRVIKPGSETIQEEEILAEETPSEEEQPEEIPVSIENLDQITGIGPKYRQLLRAAQVNTIKDVVGYEPETLLAKLLAVNQEENITKRPPTLANIEDWIEKAKN